MRIAVFGGAFNPVHNGHINLAEEYIQLLKPDKMLIIPTANPPHKADDNFADEKHRLNMLKAAFSSCDCVEISDIEFKMPGKSYTYNTVCEIKKKYSDAQIYLIVGEDQFLHFAEWFNFRELLSMVTLCTAQRNRDMAKELKSYAENVLLCSNYILADFDPVVVSSSEIRARLKNNEKVNDLIPEKVLSYINDNGLYCG